VTPAQAGDAPPPVTVPSARIGLSSASVYPESTAATFGFATELGYDAVEVMVGIDPASQDTASIKRLSDDHQMPVCSIHAPCLLITQRVWGTDPWVKLERSAEMAKEVGASTIVVHPPFRWQRDYAAEFVEGIAALEAETGLAFAVENMFPWRVSRREMQAYAPGWDPVEQDYAHATVDLSHTSTSGSDPLRMARDLGSRLHHVHLADGTGSAKDEHLVPGRGNQPCVEFLEMLARRGFEGDVVIELNTRRAATTQARQADLAEALAFTRLHFASAPLAGEDGYDDPEPLSPPRSRRSGRPRSRLGLRGR
jgi:sugar phosphate isomerase/epimerase